MIEFKGECGHTIRARDEDAGRVVRCSYCGREAPVPDEREDQLGFLLDEVERTGEHRSSPKGLGAKAQTGGATVPIRPRRDFNPFAVALKMCYAAIIITVLIVAGKVAYKKMFDVQRPARKVAAQPDKPVGSSHSGAPEFPPATGSTARGLVSPELPRDGTGIFISSVPKEATVYVRPAPTTKERMGTSIFTDREMQRPEAIGDCGWRFTRSPGRYEVAVVLSVTNMGLKRQEGYKSARQGFTDPTRREEERIKALERYFLPDRAKRVALEILPDGSSAIVRYYEEVEIVERSWTLLIALFLPRDAPLEKLMDYVPKDNLVFGFDEEEVKSELRDYLHVRSEDELYVLDVLRRIGIIPYRVQEPTPPGKAGTYQLIWLNANGTPLATSLD
ncbi:MAG: hypothetical protein V2A79_05190 [Planctomycetota bacterium]